MIESEREFGSALCRRWRLPVSYGAIGPASMLLDAVTIVLASLVAGTVYSRAAYGVDGPFGNYLGLACVLGAIVIPLAKLGGLYTPPNLLNVPRQAGSFLILWVGTLLFLTAIAFALKIGSVFSRGVVSSFAVGGYLALVAVKGGWSVVLGRALESGRLRAREVLLIGPSDPSLAEALADLRAMGLEIARFLPLPGGLPPASHEIARVLADALAVTRGTAVREVFITGGIDDLPAVTRLLEGLRVLPLPVSFIPGASVASLIGRPVQTVGASLVVEVQRAPLAALERAAKRSLDLAVAGAALLLLSPLLLGVAVAIKLDSPGPVLFRQQRRGFNGQTFRILKFRSMAVLEDGGTVPQAQRDDPRVTRVGRWLRRTSVDELPQLLNVVSGAMSLVGPRPHALAHDTYYDEVIATYAFRHHVKPGLTGWAQVNGARGETPTVESMARRVEYDLWYVDNWSLWLDVGIMLRTVVALRRADAY